MYSSFPIPHTNLSSLLEPDQLTDSPIVAVIVEVRVLDESHERAISEFLFAQCLTSTSASVSYDLC